MDTTPPAASPVARRREARRHIALCAVVGVIAGAIGSVFHLAIEAALRWPAYLRQLMDGPLLVVCAALITMVVTVAVTYVVRHYVPEASGSGIQEVEGAMAGSRQVRWARVLPVKFLGGIAAIGSGLVLGREGPTIHIAASVAAMCSDFARAGRTERAGLLAAGAAAGLACAFNAPVAAILFVIEETRREFPYTYRTYMGVIGASLLATIATEWIGGVAPDMSLSATAPALRTLPLFALLGCVLGGVGVLLNSAVLRALAFAGTTQTRAPYLYPAVVGCVIGALMVVYPQSVTGGESLVRTLLAQQTALLLLLLLATARFCTTVASYSSGVPGGIFAPMLSLAACVGLAFGAAVNIVGPDWGVTPVVFAIAAMGGLFTASVRAPLVGVVLTLELTGTYPLAVPLLTTCLVANLVASFLGGKPIYDQLLARTLAMAAADDTKKPG